MYKVIIWGTGSLYNKSINLIRYQEMQGKMCVHRL